MRKGNVHKSVSRATSFPQSDKLSKLIMISKVDLKYTLDGILTLFKLNVVLENNSKEGFLMQKEKRVWFVTGTSTGFGRQLVEQLISENELVVATARNIDKISDWSNKPNVLIETVDVTIPSQIEKAMQQAVDRWGRIDILVNNAGWGYFGSVEETDDQKVRQMMETNFWGVSNATRSVLPIMRKQESGYIINLSSIAGLLGTPSLGYYNASKHAVEGLMKSLLKEVSPLGIKITNIEPGPFRTDWAGRSHLSAPQTISAYDATAHKRTQTIEGFSGEQKGSPALVAKAIIKLSQLKNPPLHFLAGKDAFNRFQEEIEQEKIDFDNFKEDSTHLDYGDEGYWD